MVHEVNHLRNGIEVGPNYAAFQDEYRAWYVGFVAFMSRLPTKKEALERIKILFSDPDYADIQKAVQTDNPESQKILAFVGKFGTEEKIAEILAAEVDNFVAMAPLPDPVLNMTNAA